MRVTKPQGQGRRRGVILLVVLAMLTLLTVIGVTFVLYSDSAESTARIAMEGEKTIALTQPANWDTDELLAYGFGQLIYDVEDDDAGQRSGLRGHSLARDMYGYYYNQPVGSISSSATPTPIDSGAPDNDRPFRGTGRLENDKKVINFTTFKSGGVATIRDPERRNPSDSSANGLIRSGSNQYFGGFNPPYTYPDYNHLYLAKTGTDANGNLSVLEPSFYRQDIGYTLNSSDPYWDFPSAAGDEKSSVRPRPANHTKDFPKPQNNGDVRNLPWGTQNDSVWIDLGVPPKTAPNGKRYKPLFAFLAIELDGRVNVNVHGNVQGRDGSGVYAQRHASGQGWGPWEVSLERMLGVAQGKNFVLNRQPGLAITPPSTVFDVPGGSPPFSYAPVNYNASVEEAGLGVLDAPLNLPGSIAGLAFSPFVKGDSKAYGQGSSYERSATGSSANPLATDRVHGATWHPTNSVTGNTQMKHENLAWTMGRFLRSPSKYTDSLVYQLGGFGVSPFISTGRDPRFDKVTTMSWDLDRPGVAPYFGNPTAEGLALISSPTPPTKQGNASFPPILSPGSDSDGIYRANITVAAIKRLNLNRSLTPYPIVNPASGAYDLNSGDSTKAATALSERQGLAREILLTLIRATGAANPYDPTNVADTTLFAAGRGGSGSNPRYLATRWLAQLAVNIVDNLDADDVMTAFAWNDPGEKTDFVFGHELPRVAINEVYAQVQNADDDYMKMAGDNMGNFGFYVKLYTELVNPLPYDPLDGANQKKNSAVLQYAPGKPIYKLDMVRRETFVGGGVSDYRDPLKDPICVSGNDNGQLPAQRFGPDPLASGWSPSGPIYLKPMFANLGGVAGAVPIGTGGDNGFLMVGPTPSGASEIAPPSNRWTPDSAQKDMLNLPFEYQLKDASGTINKSIGSLASAPLTDLGDKQLPTLVLRRLADPGLPAGPNNPYIMVDFVEVSKQMLIENDGRKYIEDPNNAGKLKANDMANYKSVTDRKAYAKRQPFRYSPLSLPANAIDAINPAAYGKYGSLFPVSLSTPPTNEPNHTFWSINSNSGSIPVGYQPLNNGNGFETPLPRIHLDRIVTSPTELMTTPFCRPHEYQLLNDDNYSFCSPWLTPNTRLYRWLEWVQAGDTRMLVDGIGKKITVGDSGGRIPGKMNINTMTKEAFQAMCDAQQGNRFYVTAGMSIDDQINALYDQINARRTDPTKGPFIGNATEMFLGGPLSNNGSLQSVLGSVDGTPGNLVFDPFNTVAASFNPNPTGIPLGTGLPLHPGIKLELLNKIYSRMTTRSNCFAIWMTVGFFEVINENGGAGGAFQPVHVLGKELEPKIRRRFFCMVDRTNLEKWRTPVIKTTGIITNTDTSKYPYLPSSIDVPLSELNLQATSKPLTSGVTNTLNNKVFQVAIGSVLTLLEPGFPELEETVEVVDIGGGVPGIRCVKFHSNSFTMFSRGNPGPMPNLGLDYKIEKDALVVPFFAVLE